MTGFSCHLPSEMIYWGIRYSRHQKYCHVAAAVVCSIYWLDAVCAVYLFAPACSVYLFVPACLVDLFAPACLVCLFAPACLVYLFAPACSFHLFAPACSVYLFASACSIYHLVHSLYYFVLQGILNLLHKYHLRPYPTLSSIYCWVAVSRTVLTSFCFHIWHRDVSFDFSLDKELRT